MRRTIPCATRRVRVRIKPPTTPSAAAVSHTVHRQIARMLPPQPCMRSDRRIDQAPPVSKEAGDFEQGVDHSIGVHRASRLAAPSMLVHLSQHLSCPRSSESREPATTREIRMACGQ